MNRLAEEVQAAKEMVLGDLGSYVKQAAGVLRRLGARIYTASTA